MEELNMMTNETTLDGINEVDFEPVKSGNGLKVLGGVAILGVIGFGVYKLVKTLKKKKEDKGVIIDVESESEEADVIIEE